MKGFIYFIVNKETKERYVGKTTNFNRRKNEHLLALREGRHPNPKLQNSYRKYGEDKFYFEKILFKDISAEELDIEEIKAIEKHDSFEKGFNLTLGGTGGDTRSKLSFEDFCLAYFGNKKYDGMTNRTAKLLGCDSSTISAIRNEKAYDFFRERALLLSEEEQKSYLKIFEEKTNLKEQKPWTLTKITDELTFEIMCVVSTYGRGTEGAILRKFGLSKGFVFHLMTGSGRQEIKERYSKLSQTEVEEIGKRLFNEWELLSYTNLKLKEQYTDLLKKYK